MDEKALRQYFVDKACSYYGYNEADGSHKLLIDMYNKITPLPRGYRLSYLDPWCAAFVSVIAKQCDMLDIVFAECSCDRMIDTFKRAGRWQGKDYSPQIGDVVFYDWDKSGTADHVGIVISVSGLSIKVVEGNVSNRVGYRNIIVGAKDVSGYGLPDFAAKAEGKTITVPVELTKIYSNGECEVKLPVLKKGSTGSSVKALQILLISNGHDCGKYGADGDFGSGTEKALMDFQANKSLENDGIAGKDTWSALLK